MLLGTAMIKRLSNQTTSECPSMMPAASLRLSESMLRMKAHIPVLLAIPQGWSLVQQF